MPRSHLSLNWGWFQGRFYRAKGTRKAEDLGLGLYISRRLMEAMGRQIWVASEVSKGSAFSLSLPMAEG